jgi:hypothetical protein
MLHGRLDVPELLFHGNLINQYKQTSRTSDRPRTDRPRVTTHRDDRYLRTLHLRNRFLTVTSSATTTYGHRDRQIVTRPLRAAGIRAYRVYCG